MDSWNEAIATESRTLAKRLRLELKEWEQSFAAAHQGRKAGREDIKQHPEIAHKYKQYDGLRKAPSKQPATHDATPSKRRSTTNSYPVSSSRSPYKRSKHAHPVHSATDLSREPPSPQHLSPRTLRTSIGPTPQKDGQVLGLFHQLSADSISQTPSKRKALQSLGYNLPATPSKRTRSKDRADTGETHERSPLSGAKSKFLNDLLTPPTRRTTDCVNPTPRSAGSKRRFDDTPAFLRRDNRRADVGKEKILGDEEGVSWSPIAIRKLPKTAGRGLSALVRGLREMEDEGLDEELDMLREREGESAFRNHMGQPKIFVNDSQRPDMPLGPDGGLESDEDGLEHADDGKGRDGKPLKVWKKKGQKRMTRRVLMKPSTAKWKPEPAWKVSPANGHGEDGLAETQTQTPIAGRSTDYGCGSDECEDIEGGQGATELENSRKYALDNGFELNNGSAKSVKKKISATAHANFRALKIKNKQSKVKKGSRFGRKR